MILDFDDIKREFVRFALNFRNANLRNQADFIKLIRDFWQIFFVHLK